MFVIDASAILALINNEPGGDIVEQALDGAETTLMHAINLAEVFYAVLKLSGVSNADTAVQEMRMAGVDVREDLDEPLWKRAAAIKHLLLQKGIRGSFADCICAALAERHDATVLTTDHGEFDPLLADGICKVKFIR